MSNYSRPALLATRAAQRGLCFAIALGAAIGAPAVAKAQSFGPAHLPSRFSQYLGWGYGAGHHAPIIKTPLARSERVPRWTFHTPGEGPLYPAPYGPSGCGGESCYYGAGHLPVVAPLPSAIPAAAPPGRPASATPLEARRLIGP